MTIDEPLLTKLNQVLQTLNTTRAAFIRDALGLALYRYQTLEMEKRHVAGYADRPVEPDEFDVWFDEQSWRSVKP